MGYLVEKDFTKIPNNLIWSMKDLSCGAFRILVIIASFNPSYPSYSALESYTGLKRASVSKFLKELKKKKLIKIKKMKIGNMARDGNVYEVVQPTGSNIELVQNMNQFNLNTSTSSNNEPSLVQNMNCNNTNRIKLKNKTKMQADANCTTCHISTSFAIVNKLLGITNPIIQKIWIDKYGNDYIQSQFFSMEVWLISNPKKAKRSPAGAAQFITNWLKKNWDKYLINLPTVKPKEVTLEIVEDSEKERERRELFAKNRKEAEEYLRNLGHYQ